MITQSDFENTNKICSLCQEANELARSCTALIYQYRALSSVIPYATECSTISDDLFQRLEKICADLDALNRLSTRLLESVTPYHFDSSFSVNLDLSISGNKGESDHE